VPRSDHPAHRIDCAIDSRIVDVEVDDGTKAAPSELEHSNAAGLETPDDGAQIE
jgi:hypothetical protein